MQRLYEWWGHFGAVTMDVVASFWDSNLKYHRAEEWIKYVQHALGHNYSFIYAKVEVDFGIVTASSLMFLMPLSFTLIDPSGKIRRLSVKPHIGNVFKSFD